MILSDHSMQAPGQLGDSSPDMCIYLKARSMGCSSAVCFSTRAVSPPPPSLKNNQLVSNKFLNGAMNELHLVPAFDKTRD